MTAVPQDESVFADISRAAIDASGNVTYLLDAELRIVYCNPAWDAFARANGGDNLLSHPAIGANVLDVTSEGLRDFYARVFRQAISDPLPVSFDFECSSAEILRLMRMEVHHLPASRCFAVICSVRSQQAHSAESRPGDPSVYLQRSGLITMCCHCRKTRRAAEPNVWDWVPQYVRHMPTNVAHAVCETCLARFYPSFVDRMAAR